MKASRSGLGRVGAALIALALLSGPTVAGSQAPSPRSESPAPRREGAPSRSAPLPRPAPQDEAPVPLERPGEAEPPISERPPTRNTRLYHGNYCGAGDNGPGLPPIDELDEVCMRHDQCYEQAGRPSCACDRALATGALVIANSSRFSRDLRARAASVAEAGQLMTCSQP